jgi:hypothetical protein
MLPAIFSASLGSTEGEVYGRVRELPVLERAHFVLF